jgi:hypothetical protein
MKADTYPYLHTRKGGDACIRVCVYIHVHVIIYIYMYQIRIPICTPGKAATPA